MIQELQTHRLVCDTCCRSVLLRTEIDTKLVLPASWASEDNGDICDRCRALRGDFGEEAKKNVAAMQTQGARR